MAARESPPSSRVAGLMKYRTTIAASKVGWGRRTCLQGVQRQFEVPGFAAATVVENVFPAESRERVYSCAPAWLPQISFRRWSRPQFHR